jgi:hypothetical protein
VINGKEKAMEKENSNRKIGGKSFERVEQFEYLGTMLTNQNSIH